jgi:hypothetical protein
LESSEAMELFDGTLEWKRTHNIKNKDLS